VISRWENIMNDGRSSILRAGLAAFCLLAFAGCSSLSPTQQRVLSGGSIGSTVGLVATVATGGCFLCGSTIGGLIGSGLGYAYDQLQYQKPPGEAEVDPSLTKK
jgi:osmotically inducible lipoprotein OsmB